MIAALGEGITQSLLPCSWTLLVPAIALGLASRKLRVLGVFTGAAVITAWVAAAGWLVAPLWLAGAALLVGAVLWWRRGSASISAVAIGVGAAWAWRPCVGQELGEALTTAQHDPPAAAAGLGAFLIGVIIVGLVIGLVAGSLVRRWTEAPLDRAGTVVIGLLGLVMVLGIYPRIASRLIQWSTALWA